MQRGCVRWGSELKISIVTKLPAEAIFLSAIAYSHSMSPMHSDVYLVGTHTRPAKNTLLERQPAMIFGGIDLRTELNDLTGKIAKRIGNLINALIKPEGLMVLCLRCGLSVALLCFGWLWSGRLRITSLYVAILSCTLLRIDFSGFVLGYFASLCFVCILSTCVLRCIELLRFGLFQCLSLCLFYPALL